MATKILTADQMTLKLHLGAARRAAIAAMRCTVAAELGRSPFDAAVRSEAVRRVGR